MNGIFIICIATLLSCEVRGEEEGVDFKAHTYIYIRSAYHRGHGCEHSIVYHTPHRQMSGPNA